MPTTLPTPDEARARILEAVAPLREVVQRPLAAGFGGTLARDLVGAHAVPPADNASMDGVALRHADLEAGHGSLRVVGRAAAGDPQRTLTPGTAMTIFTGATLPVGADTVVPQERYVVVAERLQLHPGASVRCGANVRRRAEDLRPGAVVLRAGQRLRPQDLGVAASVGLAEVPLRRPARVALVTSGNELHRAGVPLPDGGLYDSNTPMLAALVGALGGEVVSCTAVVDEPLASERALAAAAAGADLVITTGGVSVGAVDLLRGTVARLGEVQLWRVAVKPGKPLAFGRIGGAHWLGLPGNPVSALVTFLLFGAPIVRRLHGREQTFPEPLRLRIGFSRDGTQGREEYLRVAYRGGVAEAYPQQGSGVLSGAVWGDGLARVPAHAPLSPGDTVDAWTFTELFW
jgi:molybdopterin molybdotransferase